MVNFREDENYGKENPHLLKAYLYALEAANPITTDGLQHRQLVDGKTYQTFHRETGLSDGESFMFALESDTQNTVPLDIQLPDINTEGKVYLNAYKNPTIDRSAWDEANIVNLRSDNTEIAGATALYDTQTNPTIGGTQVSEATFGTAASGQGASSRPPIGGTTQSGTLLILAPNDVALIEVVNQSGETQDISFNWQFNNEPGTVTDT
jgi:hypothetical protein